MNKKSFFIIISAAVLSLTTAACGSSTANTTELKSAHTQYVAETTAAILDTLSADEESTLEKALSDLLDGIYAAKTGSISETDSAEKNKEASAAADTLLNFVQKHGAEAESDKFTSMANEALKKLAEENGNDSTFYDNFNASLDAVCTVASSKDASITSASYYANVINGIDMAIYQLAPADSTEVSASELNDSFSQMLEAIYQTKDADDTEDNLTNVAIDFLAYIVDYGEVSSVQGYEALAKEKLPDMRLKYGISFYSDFKVCLENVSQRALSEEPSWETNLSYTNIINGIALALEELK